MAKLSNPVRIQSLVSREVLDSRGLPTVEVDLTVTLEGTPGSFLGRAIVPSGASTGEHEALELRDGDSKRYHGKGVLKALSHIDTKICPAILGQEFARQPIFDDLLRELDGTPNKSNLGANAVLPVSMAFLRAHALAHQKNFFEWTADLMASPSDLLPVPLMNILNGGKHADNGLDIQEFMIVPVGFPNFKRALQAGSEIFFSLKKILKTMGLSTGVGDEGGFAPQFSGEKCHEQALDVILQAVDEAGYKAGKEIYLALDCAASEFGKPEIGGSEGSVRYQFEGRGMSSEDMIALFENWLEKYPILSIEDGLSEHDWNGWAELTARVGRKCQLVGDDLFVTNPLFLNRGIEQKVANAILIKLNQIGTVTETLETMKLAAQHDYGIITSHRSGESEDSFIADLAVGSGCGQIKTGSLCRTDRTAKYNQLLRIEEILGKNAKYAGKSAFRGLI